MPKELKFHKFIKPYVVDAGEGFRLKDHDPGDIHGLKSQDKPEATKWLEQGVVQLSALQDILFAQGNWGLLLIFQAMDAAGNIILACPNFADQTHPASSSQLGGGPSSLSGPYAPAASQASAMNLVPERVGSESMSQRTGGLARTLPEESRARMEARSKRKPSTCISWTQ